MKVNVRFFIGLALTASLMLDQTRIAPAQSSFSANPRYPLQSYELRRGNNVQRFSGQFVQSLSREWGSSAAKTCLGDKGSSQMILATFAGGEVRPASGNDPCADLVSPNTGELGTATGSVSIAADRVLALLLVSARFSSDPAFRTNDRDIADYDVEIFGKNGVLQVDLEPLALHALTRTNVTAGCPSTGPISAPYFVDPKTWTVRLGIRQC
jgi:hypothetical protein